MKTQFTVKEMKRKRGCYSMKKLMALPFMSQEIITIEDILLSDIPLRDKKWMVWNNCKLTPENKSFLSLQLAWLVLPIYEARYPKDLMIREVLESVEQFNKKEINEIELKTRINTACKASEYIPYCDASFAVNSIANAVATIIHTKARRIDASSISSYYSFCAAVHSDNDLYKNQYLQILLNFFKENEKNYF